MRVKVRGASTTHLASIQVRHTLLLEWELEWEGPGPLILQPRQPWLEAHFFCGGTFAWCNTSFGRESSRYVDYTFCVKCAPFKQWIWIKCAPSKCGRPVTSALLLIMIHVNTVYTWFTQFGRKIRLVAITRFWEAHLCSSVVVGGTKTFWGPGGCLSSITKADWLTWWCRKHMPRVQVD